MIPTMPKATMLSLNGSPELKLFFLYHSIEIITVYSVVATNRPTTLNFIVPIAYNLLNNLESRIEAWGHIDFHWPSLCHTVDMSLSL